MKTLTDKQNKKKYYNHVMRFNKVTTYSILVLMFLAFVWVTTSYILDAYYLSKQKKYAITTRLESGSGSVASGTSYLYHFTVNSKEYGGNTSSVRSMHDHYFVEFYPPDPSHNSFTVIKATADDIKQMPPSGFDSLPHR